MALEVEDGTGKANADAYASAATVTAYLEAYNPSTTWAALDTAAQEVIIRRKTQEMDALFAGRWPGSIASLTQALAWPRVNAIDAYGRSIGVSEVPTLVEWALGEACKLAADGHELTPDRVDTERSKTRELVKIGPLTFEDAWGAGGQGSDRFERFDSLMGLILGVDSPKRGSSISAISLGRA